MPKLLLYTGIALIVLALILGGVLYWQFDLVGRGAFWSNILLNLIAELIGIAVGLILPLLLFAWIAGKMVEKAATPIAELIAQLRAEGRISEEAARRSVVCAVNLISEDHISLKSNNRFSLDFEKGKCDVCDLEIRIGEDKRCDFCGLKKHVWEIKNKPIIRPTSSSP